MYIFLFENTVLYVYSVYYFMYALDQCNNSNVMKFGVWRRIRIFIGSSVCHYDYVVGCVLCIFRCKFILLL